MTPDRHTDRAGNATCQRAFVHLPAGNPIRTAVQARQPAGLLRLTPTCLALWLTARVAMAQGTTSLQPEPGFTTGLFTRGNLLGDAGGLRSALWNYGITFGIQDTNEVWGNVTGGIKRGASYDGLP